MTQPYDLIAALLFCDKPNNTDAGISLGDADQLLFGKRYDENAAYQAPSDHF